MPLYKFNSHPAPGFHADGSFVVQDTRSPISLKTRTPNKVTADFCGGGGGGYGSGGGGGVGGFYSSGTGVGGGSGGSYDSGSSGIGFSGGQSSANVDSYNPVRDRLEEGSIVEDWIPRDASGLDEMFKLMYNRDHLAGVMVDLLAEMIWSDFDLVGIQDPVIRNIYQETMGAIDIVTTGPELTREYMVLGRSISSMIFDKDRGIFDDIISHDPSFVRLTPIPIKGFDPKIDLIPSPSLRQFVESVDPRDMDVRKILPASFVDAIRAAGGKAGARGFGGSQSLLGGRDSSSGGGGIPLDPINTLFLPRRSFGHDNIGTSFYTRLITFWALEKALINASVASARRRVRSVLHIKCGIDNLWEPSAQEMDNIAGMFIQADEDPIGAVVCTRTGVDTSEIRAGQDFYKWADEWGMLNEGKMRAMGANEALLSAEATYSNQETAKLFFMEKVVRLRETLTARIFYNKLFPLVARIHGFKKRTQAQLDHRIRVEGSDTVDNKLTQRQSLEIPFNQLIMPTISWHKSLVNEVNTAKLDVYEKLEEKGVPIHLRDWAGAGGVDLDDQMSGLETDADVRQQVAKWKSTYESTETEQAEDSAKLEFVKSLRNLAHSNLKTVLGSAVQNLGPLASFIFWDRKGMFGPVTANEVVSFLDGIKPDDNSCKALFDDVSLKHRLFTNFQNPVKMEIGHYLIYRSGLTPLKPSLSRETISIISTVIKDSLDQYGTHGSVYQLAKIAEKELNLVAALSEERLIPLKKNMGSKVKNVEGELRQKRKGMQIDGISNKSLNLYSGC
jgi:hypothetical protein